MRAFLISAGAVALAEIGDKTQFLSLALSARYRRPWPIIAGILAATLLNHAAAGALGEWLTTRIPPEALRWIVGLSFLAMAAWILVPDKAPEAEEARPRLGVFIATTAAFFLAEMGDKTQIATIALAARFHALFQVVAGTTVGMLAANAPVVLIGGAAARLPLLPIRIATSLIFAALGLAALLYR